VGGYGGGWGGGGVDTENKHPGRTLLESAHDTPLSRSKAITMPRRLAACTSGRRASAKTACFSLRFRQRFCCVIRRACSVGRSHALVHAGLTINGAAKKHHLGEPVQPPRPKASFRQAEPETLPISGDYFLCSTKSGAMSAHRGAVEAFVFPRLRYAEAALWIAHFERSGLRRRTDTVPSPGQLRDDLRRFT